ncbi:hypothetical protein [Streptomyces sp. NPDC041003]|uniref:hypothetical protein n=1 Tax=Streptomyces sp. NPDC041003 TaxID=3155730 RepID=UPI0033F9B510
MKKDFALGAALSTVADKWHDQLGTLLDACAHISNHLDYTQNAHAEDGAAFDGNQKAQGLAGAQ